VFALFLVFFVFFLCALCSKNGFSPFSEGLSQQKPNFHLIFQQNNLLQNKDIKINVTFAF